MALGGPRYSLGKAGRSRTWKMRSQKGGRRSWLCPLPIPPASWSSRFPFLSGHPCSFLYTTIFFHDMFLCHTFPTSFPTLSSPYSYLCPASIWNRRHWLSSGASLSRPARLLWGSISSHRGSWKLLALGADNSHSPLGEAAGSFIFFWTSALALPLLPWSLSEGCLLQVVLSPGVEASQESSSKIHYSIPCLVCILWYCVRLESQCNPNEMYTVLKLLTSVAFKRCS